MIDLHMHSRYSDDGEFAPEELVRQCCECDITVMSVTDHNCARANGEAEQAAQRYGMPTFKETRLMPETAVARLSWISYIKPMPSPTKVTRQRLGTDLRSWRNICIPCRWKITTQCSTSAADCAMHTNGKPFGTACNTGRILLRSCISNNKSYLQRIF